MIKISQIVSLLCFSQLSFAHESNDIKGLTANLLKLVQTELEYSGHVDPPKIIPQTEEQLRDRFCPKQKCDVSGIYSSGVIYIDKRIDIKNVNDVSIIYHGLIHHVQQHIYGTTYDCDMWLEKEKQAYSLQKKYLKSRGFESNFISKPFLADLKCPK